jgi:hypothetical protein
MSDTLIVRFTIPVGENEFAGSCITFQKWIPDGKTFCLIRTRGDIKSEIWLDRSCVSCLQEITDELISSWLNIQISKLFVDISFSDLPTKLIQFLREKGQKENPDQNTLSSDDSHGELNKAYCDLGVRAISEAIEGYNRVLSYCRNYKGQFWLQERTFNPGLMSSQSLKFNAIATISNEKWFRWYPNAPTELKIIVQPETISVTKNDWRKIQEFVSDYNRPDFVLELLANSQSFIAEGYRRSAIIDSVTALEIAISRFADSPNTSLFMTTESVSRVNISRLSTQVKHMGLSGTIGYLLPVLLSEHMLSTDILVKCQRAIEVRNTIVHKGQRDISEREARPLVSAVREMCHILSTLSIQDAAQLEISESTK